MCREGDGGGEDSEGRPKGWERKIKGMLAK